MSCIKKIEKKVMYQGAPVRSSFYQKCGFTFIELVIVVAMVSVISLTLYTTLNNGIKIWQRSNKPLPEEELCIFFSKFTHDIRNSFQFKGIDFSGRKDEMGFATVVDSTRLNTKSIGKVTYLYNSDAGIVTRQQMDISDVYKGGRGITTHTLKKIKSLRFRYYLFDTQKKEYFWREYLSDGTLPLAVRAEFELDNEDDDVQKFIIKTVNIPLSG
ncbi:MAG: prepilin-type N-terminal cleavage/methylation domain-containing protein [Candidatus Omnitrophota bacterium]